MIPTNIKDLKREIKVLIKKYKEIAPKEEISKINKIIALLPLCNDYNALVKIHIKLKTLVKE
jgi:hypothetical protein